MKKSNKRNLTIAFAKSVELPAKGDVIYRDLKTPGLGLRVYASGKKSWIFVKKLGKDEIKSALGDILNLPLESTYNPKTGENLKGARQLANEATLLVNQGIDPRLEKVEKIKITKSKMAKQNLTVKVIWDEYIEHKLALPKKPPKPRTIKDWDSARVKLAESAFWHQPVNELTGLKLADEVKRQSKLAKSKVASNRGMTQASLILRYLKAAYNHASVVHKLEHALAFKELDNLLPSWNTTNASKRRIGEIEGELSVWWSAVDKLRESAKPDSVGNHPLC